AGERVLPEDFRPAATEEIELRDNAARDLAAAAAIVDDDSPAADTIDWVPTTMPVETRVWPYLDRAVEWFGPALRRIERAQHRQRRGPRGAARAGALHQRRSRRPIRRRGSRRSSKADHRSLR